MLPAIVLLSSSLASHTSAIVTLFSSKRLPIKNNELSVSGPLLTTHNSQLVTLNSLLTTHYSQYDQR